jgi:hypothetical protein
LKKIILIILIILLSGCSKQLTENKPSMELEEYKPSIELINSTVKIVSDKPEQQPIVDGKLMENIGFVSLKYDFILENNGEGDFKVNQGSQTSENDVKTITLTIEPTPELKAFASEVTGVNLFSEKNYGGSFSSVPSILSPNKNGHYSIEYVLGSIEKNPEMVLSPNKEKLNELQEKAKKANLVIYYQNEEIQRFELNN